jgi:hypothetical protein
VVRCSAGAMVRKRYAIMALGLAFVEQETEIIDRRYSGNGDKSTRETSIYDRKGRLYQLAKCRYMSARTPCSQTR